MSKRGLATDGLKADLVNRLQARLDEEEFGLDEDITAPTTTTPTKVDSVEVQEAITSESSKGQKSQEEKIEKNYVKPDTVEEIPTETKKDEIPSEDKIEAKAATTSSSSSTTKKTSDLSFEEAKKARAERFGIPMTFEEKKAKRAERFGLKDANDKGQTNEKKRNQKQSTNNNNNKQKVGSGNKKQKKNNASNDSKGTKEALLSKEEILKRLERGEKYGGNPEQTDKLKAMLRKHRFNSAD